MPEHCPRLENRALRCWLALPALAWLATLAPAVELGASELRNSAIVKAVHETEAAVVNIHGRKTVRAENASFGTPDAVGRALQASRGPRRLAVVPGATHLCTEDLPALEREAGLALDWLLDQGGIP